MVSDVPKTITENLTRCNKKNLPNSKATAITLNTFEYCQKKTHGEVTLNTLNNGKIKQGFDLCRFIVHLHVARKTTKQI